MANKLENSTFLTKQLKGKRIRDTFIEEIEFQKRLSYHNFKGEESGLLKYKITKEDGTMEEVYGFHSSKKKSIRFFNKRNILTKLEEYGFEKGNLGITKVIGFYPELNLFLREGAKGSTLLSMLEEKDLDSSKVIKYSAHWIQQLHSLKPEKGVFKSSISVEKEYFKEYQKTVSKYFKKEDMKGIVKAFLKTSKEYSVNIITHGDFQPQNIIYDKETNKLIVIDFDWAGVGDPLSDIGDFLLQFDYKMFPFYGKEEIIEFKKHFLNSYLEKSGPYKDLHKRINHHQAKFAIRRASYILGAEEGRTEGIETVSNLIEKAKICLKDEKLNLKVLNYNLQIQ